MYDSHVNGLRGCFLTFAPVCVWLTTGNMCLKILLIAIKIFLFSPGV